MSDKDAASGERHLWGSAIPRESRPHASRSAAPPSRSVASLALAVPTSAVTSHRHRCSWRPAIRARHRVAQDRRPRRSRSSSSARRPTPHVGQAGVKVPPPSPRARRTQGQDHFLRQRHARPRTAKLRKGKAAYRLPSTTTPGSSTRSPRSTRARRSRSRSGSTARRSPSRRPRSRSRRRPTRYDLPGADRQPSSSRTPRRPRATSTSTRTATSRAAAARPTTAAWLPVAGRRHVQLQRLLVPRQGPGQGPRHLLLPGVLHRRRGIRRLHLLDPHHGDRHPLTLPRPASDAPSGHSDGASSHVGLASAAAAPDDDGLTGLPAGGGWRSTGSLLAGPSYAGRRPPGAAPPGSPRARPASSSLRCDERGDPVLEVEDPAYALDADAGRGEVGDLAQQLDVAVGVAAAAAAGAAGRDQPHPLVGAQRLRVQPAQLGGDADDVDGAVRARAARRLGAPATGQASSKSFDAQRLAGGRGAVGLDRLAGGLRRAPRAPAPRRWRAGRPWCRRTSVAPLPRTRKVRPLGVPAGTLRVTGDAAERRDLDLGAERELVEGDRHVEGEVVVLAAEEPVRRRPSR